MSITESTVANNSAGFEGAGLYFDLFADSFAPSTVSASVDASTVARNTVMGAYEQLLAEARSLIRLVDVRDPFVHVACEILDAQCGGVQKASSRDRAGNEAFISSQTLGKN